MSDQNLAVFSIRRFPHSDESCELFPNLPLEAAKKILEYAFEPYMKRGQIMHCSGLVKRVWTISPADSKLTLALWLTRPQEVRLRYSDWHLGRTQYTDGETLLHLGTIYGGENRSETLFVSNIERALRRGTWNRRAIREVTHRERLLGRRLSTSQTRRVVNQMATREPLALIAFNPPLGLLLTRHSENRL